MSFRSRICDLLFCFTIGSLFSYSLARAAMAATIVPYSQVLLLWLCAVMTLILYMVFFNRITVLVTLGVLLLSGGITYLLLWRGGFQAAWYQGLLAQLEELFRFAQDLIPYRQRYTFPILLGVAFATALVTAVNLQLRFNFYILTLVALGVFGIPIYLDYGTSKVAMLLFVLCFVVLLAKKLNLNAVVADPPPQKHKRPQKRNPVFSLAVIPACVLLVGAAYLMPKPHMPTDSRSLIEAADNFVFDISARKTMFFSGEDEDMGGEIVMDEGFVMDVYADERLYLGGIIRDTYTGSAWAVSEEDWEQLYARNESGWFWYPDRDYSPELREAQLYYMGYFGRNIASATVSLGSVRSKTVFSPPFRTDLWLSDDTPLSRNSLGELNTGRPLGRYTNYVQEYISWDYTDEYLVYLLQGLTRDGGERAEDDRPMEAFLQLPQSLPPRVGALAEELTAGCTNDYDRVKALERYLATFPYTLNPDKPPQNADFVDYFLFEGQEGYCVYYASALAVMGRSLGIPTRYVEGFALPEQRGDHGAYTVTNAQAHAWAEVWFPGFGWVPFEATAPNYELLYNGEWPDDSEPMLQTEVEPEELPEAEQPVPEDLQGLVIPTATVEGAGRTGGVIALSLVAIALLSVLLKVWFYNRRLRRMESLPNREAVTVCFDRVLRSAAALGYPHTGHETAFAYARRVGAEPVFTAPEIRLGEVAAIFSRASYSLRETGDEEREAMFRCYHALLAQLKQRKYGRLRYYVNRYLLSKF